MTISHYYWQKDLREVADFWGRSAEWRARYFSELGARKAEYLGYPLKLEREFVLAEDAFVTEIASSAKVCVELGSGVGRSLWIPCAENPQGIYLGIDISGEELRVFLRERNKRGLNNLFPIMSNVERTPIISGSVDTILICNQTLGNFLGDGRANMLKEICRMTTKGSVVYVGGFDKVEVAADCYRAWGVEIVNIDEQTGFCELQHYNSLWQKEGDVINLFKDAGFGIVKNVRVELGYLLLFSKLNR